MNHNIDLNHVAARHDEINIRLEQWARWVRVKPQRWGIQPMFLGYQSKARQWEAEPHIHVEMNTLEAYETERAVSFLPEPYRTLVRWFYVYSWVPVHIIRKNFGLTKDGMADTLTNARDMLKNRLKQKLVDMA